MKGPNPRVKLLLATIDDALDVSELRNAVADRLTETHGKGPWSGHGSARGVLFNMRRSEVYLARTRGRIVATLALGTRKPWAIDPTYFSPAATPLYLTSMAVAPDRQRSGIGRACLEEAKRIARARPADAIRLDAFEAAAGAGGFYRKCGWREVGRKIYRNSPLVYFEMPIAPR